LNAFKTVDIEIRSETSENIALQTLEAACQLTKCDMEIEDRIE